MICVSIYHSAEGGKALRSRGFAIWPQSVTGKAHAPGARMSPGALQCVKKPSRQAILPQNRPDFRVIARPQRGRGNLEGEGMASRGEAREHVAKEKPYYKKGDSLRRFASSFFILRFCFVPPYHSSFRNDKSHR